MSLPKDVDEASRDSPWVGTACAVDALAQVIVGPYLVGAEHHASRITHQIDSDWPEAEMRTTLNIDDDVLASVQFLARERDQTVGAVMSELARRALKGSAIDPTPEADGARRSSPLARKLASLGLVPFAPPGGKRVTAAMVEALRDSEGV